MSEMRIESGFPEEIEALAKQIVDAAFKVHSQLGPGLLESVYETCLCHELRRRGIAVSNQVRAPIVFEGLELEAALRLDLLVGNEIVVEVKAIEKLLRIHEAQVLTYLKLTHKKLGFLINFNVELFRDGIKRIVLSRPS